VLCVVVGYSAWAARIPRSAKATEGDEPGSIEVLPGGRA
jgi:hypothetical protein